MPSYFHGPCCLVTAELLLFSELSTGGGKEDLCRLGGGKLKGTKELHQGVCGGVCSGFIDTK